MIADKIIAYESGKLKEQEGIELFAELVRLGICLGSRYKWIVEGLIRNKVITSTGKVIHKQEGYASQAQNGAIILG